MCFSNSLVERLITGHLTELLSCHFFFSAVLSLCAASCADALSSSRNDPTPGSLHSVADSLTRYFSERAVPPNRCAAQRYFVALPPGAWNRRGLPWDFWFPCTPGPLAMAGSDPSLLWMSSTFSLESAPCLTLFCSLAIRGLGPIWFAMGLPVPVHPRPSGK